MSDLISREAAIDHVKSVFCKGCNNYEGIRCRACEVDDVLDVFDSVPAVDAVEVVRCKDCVHSILLKDTNLRKISPWRYFREDCRVCRCNALIGDEPIVVDDDCYCAYGAKMDGEV